MKIILLTCCCCHLTLGWARGQQDLPGPPDSQSGARWVFDHEQWHHDGGASHNSSHCWRWVTSCLSPCSHWWSSSDSSRSRALLCWWLHWAVLNLVQSFWVSLELEEVTHCPASWCCVASHVAKAVLISGLTGSLVRVSCHCLAAAYGCGMEKARGLGRHHFVLISVYLEHVNANKHSSGLEGYWLCVFLAHRFSVKRIRKHFCGLWPSRS